MPNPLLLVPELFSLFSVPGSNSPLYLVDADLRTDQRLPLVRIQKPEALGKNRRVLPWLQADLVARMAVRLICYIDYGELREILSQVII